MTDYAAVLWDLDGTIIDSEPLWMAGEHELAEKYGKTWTQEDGLALVGNSLIGSGEYIKERLEADMSAEEIVDFLVVRLAAALREEIPWRPGARELIDALHAEGTPQALVTMSYAVDRRADCRSRYRSAPSSPVTSSRGASRTLIRT